MKTIHYTEDDLKQVDAKESEIFDQTIIARNTGDKALKLMQELKSLHTQIAIKHHKAVLAGDRKP